MVQHLVQGLLQRPAKEGRGSVLATDPVFLCDCGGGDHRRGVSALPDADADDPLAGVAHRKAFQPLAGGQKLLPAGAGRLHR
ncbi:hypothetical protein D3C75_1190000 [compost metagenome]